MAQPFAQKIPLLIASTLKPIRDIRAFGKLALSLGETNTYELNIIGFSLKKPKSEAGIRFFPSMSVFDSRLDRILAQLRFLRCLFQVRPKILVCCAYELLPIASALKSTLGYKLVYDVQENYRANLALNPDLSQKKKQRIDWLIQRAEQVSYIDLFLLAEKCYAEEMPDKKPYVILENKFQGKIRPRGPIDYAQKEKFHFCISGTITPAFGTLDAIAWFREVLNDYPESRLQIVGHCPLESFRGVLTQLGKEIPQLALRLDQHPIPHKILLDVMGNADFVLLPYQLQPAIAPKMPTKLFECAALGIPVLITPNPIWTDLINEFSGGQAIDFSDLYTARSQFKAALKQVYFTSTPSPSILWTTEAADLQLALQNLLQ